MLFHRKKSQSILRFNHQQRAILNQGISPSCKLRCRLNYLTRVNSYYFPQNGFPYATTAQQIMMRSGQAPSQVPRAGSSSANAGASSSSGGDIATMNDVLGSAGVDLRVRSCHLNPSASNHETPQAEEEGLHRNNNAWQSHTSQPGDRSRNQMQVNSQYLGQLVRTIATHHKVSKVPDESVHYLAFALRARLEGLIQRMIEAAHHRTKSDVLDPPPKYEDGTPMWSKIVRRDVAKQLLVLSE